VKIPEKVKAGGAKGHCYKESFKTNRSNELVVMNQKNVGAEAQGELFKRRRSEIPDAERISELQEKLYQKAKQERGYKFYVLYDKMFVPYILREAWKHVKMNDGAPGVDGITVAGVEKYGIELYLKELGEELRKQTYQPQAVKRVMISKASGGQRPLGIPTVRDRIAQTACKMILEPIFEADFEESSYPRILKLINKWLRVSVYEDGQYGIRIVRYADDFVLMGKTLPIQIIERLKIMLQRMGLSLNEEKTRLLDASMESFDFLGFTIRYDQDIKGRNTRYWNIMPSKKSEQKIREKVKAYLKTHGHCKAQEVATGLNTIMRGWLNYFEIKGISYPSMSKRRLRVYLRERLHRYYNRKSQRKCRLYGQKAFEVLVTKFMLIDPSKHVNLSARL
jgi:hypothetical protein